MTDRVHNPAEREVVIGDLSSRSRRTDRNTGGMIATDRHYDQVRQIPFLNILSELGEEDIHPILVRNTGIKRWIVQIEILFHARHIRTSLEITEWDMQLSFLFTF